MINKLIILLLLLLGNNLYSQCNGAQSFSLNPAPINNSYAPGTVVTICYTMVGYNMISVNWLEGFDLTLGNGWTNVTPLSPPNNCGGNNSGGSWVWRNTVTASATGLQFGPGYFFDLDNDGNPGNDFGDQGSCTWSFCFRATVSPNNCNPQNLLIQVTAGGDGTMGSWINNSCTLVPFTIFNGTISPVIPNLGLITHN